MWCSKQAAVPALWLFPFNLAHPILCGGSIEQLGNYRSEELCVWSVVSFEGELQEGQDRR